MRWWSKEEDEFLRQNFPSMSAPKMGAEIGRTTHAVNTRTRLLGLHRWRLDGNLAGRFWSRVRIGEPDECWEWQGNRDGCGYGTIWVNGRNEHAQRFSWRLIHGDIPHGMLICHHCDNPPCVNPSHLFLGTTRDNVDDKMRKGRFQSQKGSDNNCAKLTDDDVIEIRRRVADGERQKDLLSEYGITSGCMSMIVNGKTWRHIAIV